MRGLAGTVMLLAVSSACVTTTRTLSSDVEYSFRDQNGVGWVTLDGNVTVTFTFTGEDGSLHVRGKRRIADHLLTDDTTEGPPPGLETSEWEGDVEETFPLLDVERTGKTITFEFDIYDDHLTGSCAPMVIAELDRTSIYECKITGFGWQPAADLPELHHPIVLDADTDAKTRIINSMTGATQPNFGQRTVREE